MYKRKREDNEHGSNGNSSNYSGHGGHGGHGGHRDSKPPAATRLRRALAELGEPSRVRVEDSIKDVAVDLAEISAEGRDSVLGMVRAVVVEQPHKVSLLAATLDVSNELSSSFALAVVEMIHDELSKALNTSNYKHIKQYIRFLCSLGFVEFDTVHGLLVSLADRALTLRESSAGHSLYLTAVLGAIYLAHSGAELSEELTQALAAFTPGGLEHQDVAAPLFGSDLPYQPEPIIVHVNNAVKQSLASGNGLDHSFLLDIKALSDRVGLGPKHRFPAVHVPAAGDLLPYQPSGEVLAASKAETAPFRTLVYLATETVPKPDSLFGVVVRDVASDIIDSMDFNRKEVTRQLITLDLFFNNSVFAEPGVSLEQLNTYAPEASRFKVEDVALEAVLEKMMQLPLPEFPTVYFDTVLIEACIMAPQAIAPVLGRAFRFFFDNSASLDAELLWRVIEWFAHHVSNFGFTWKWNEWLDALQLPAHHPKQIFMRELVSKQIRLSYAQRVRDALPSEFQHLVPEIPEVPEFAFENDELVKSLAESLDKNPDQVKTIMDQIRDRTTQESIGKEVAALDRSLVNIVVSTVLNLGNTSPSHTATWIERTAQLVKETATQETYVIDATLEYWKATPWVGILAVEQFIRRGVISSSTVVSYVFSHRELLLSSVGWETLLRHYENVPAHLDQLQGSEEWDNWWDERLKKALVRRVEAEGVRKEFDAEQLRKKEEAAEVAERPAKQGRFAPPPSEPAQPETVETAETKAEAVVGETAAVAEPTETTEVAETADAAEPTEAAQPEVTEPEAAEPEAAEPEAAEPEAAEPIAEQAEQTEQAEAEDTEMANEN